MNRRELLRLAVAVPLLPVPLAPPAAANSPFRRVPPSDPAWPSADRWDRLNQAVGGRLIKVQPLLAACANASDGTACQDLIKYLRNPYYVGDQPAGTQTAGWVDAWMSAPSVYAVAARTTADVVAAVNFARENRLRLVVKGGGHSYQGTSDAADSLLIWTRAMNGIVLHDAFVPQGCEAKLAVQPAVTVDAGAVWMHVYDAVTTKAGRYVQGGGCATVGVAGLIQSGGFGSFSKNYGIAAAGLLEAEIVTADGQVRIANACTNPDLFWGIKGGGGGSLGVVTRLTLRTRELPTFFGGVDLTVKAASEAAFRRLIGRFVGFCGERLLNPHWGESANFGADNTLAVGMVFQGLDRQQAEAVWRPFIDWIDGISARLHRHLAARPRGHARRGTGGTPPISSSIGRDEHSPINAPALRRTMCGLPSRTPSSACSSMAISRSGCPPRYCTGNDSGNSPMRCSRPHGTLPWRCISTRGSPAPAPPTSRRPGTRPPTRRC